MFELSKIPVYCNSCSLNQENIGEADHRLGVTLKLMFTGSNELLNRIDDGLREMFYQPAGGGRQDDMTGHLPELRKHSFSSIPLKFQSEGYKVDIWRSLELKKALSFADVKLHKLSVDLRAEGKVQFSFDLYLHPDPKLVGALGELMKNEIIITLTAPAMSEEQSIPPAGAQTGEQGKGEGDPDFDLEHSDKPPEGNAEEQEENETNVTPINPSAGKSGTKRFTNKKPGK